MRSSLLVVSAFLVLDLALGSPIFALREKLHTKVFGHDLSGHGGHDSSPVVNINNYQEMNQQASAVASQGHLKEEFSNGNYGNHHGHMRGDYGHNFAGMHGMGNNHMNNFKAGGISYQGHGDAGSGYDMHHSLKHESFMHRERPVFGQHHDTNIFGNTRNEFGSANAASASSASSSSSSEGSPSFYGPNLPARSGSASSSSSSASSSAVSSSSSSSSASSNGNGVHGSGYHYGPRPWRY